MNDDMGRAAKLWTLFRTTFMISLTSNSGYAILSVMKSEYVNRYKWFTDDEMADTIALAQSAPGPIAVNSSMVTGYRVAGLAGAMASVLGCAIPPLAVMILVTFFYRVIVANRFVAMFMRGMQYGVAAMLLDVLIGLFTNVMKKEKVYPAVLIALSFLYVELADRSIFFLAAGCIAVAAVKSFLIGRKVKGGEA